MRYKVWVVLGKERLELPTKFEKEEEGRRKVARLVLQRLKIHGTKRQDTEKRR
jgi:hypothetical protein